MPQIVLSDNVLPVKEFWLLESFNTMPLPLFKQEFPDTLFPFEYFREMPDLLFFEQVLPETVLPLEEYSKMPESLLFNLQVLPVTVLPLEEARVMPD